MNFLRPLLGAATALGAAGRWAVYRRPLPPVEGTLPLPGLGREVLVERDGAGVPTIRAGSWLDALRAQGFVHAQDRYWQLELQRATAQGRLCEMFGSRTLPQDRYLRRLNLEEIARAEFDLCDPEERDAMQAYTDGINQFLRIGALPTELWLLHIRPDPWEPWHCVLWVKMLSHDLACNWEAELFRARLLQKVGPKQAAAWALTVPSGMPLIMGGQTPNLRERLVREFEEATAWLDGCECYITPWSTMTAGSNAWALAGSRTADGFPMLANDPHIVARVPSFWYQNRLVTPDHDMVGASMPGLPGLILGHNHKLSWGVTNAYVDVQDLFLERFHPEDDHRVAFREEWEPTRERKQTLKVRGGRDETLYVKTTRHGPLLTGIRKDRTALALSWTGYTPAHFFRALHALNRAGSVLEAQEVLKDWMAPALCFVLADRENIGMQVVGKVPRRRKGSGLVPVPGWTGEYDWDGFLPFDELPRQYNPESGVIVAANHCPATEPWLSWDFNPGVRAQRIEEVLASKERHDLWGMRELQLDEVSLLGLRFRDCCRGLETSGEEQAVALDLLLNWDGHTGAQSVGACIYELCLIRLAHAVFQPPLGEDFTRDLLGEVTQNPMSGVANHASRYHVPLVQALEKRDPDWAEDWDALLQAAFEQTVELLSKRLGSDPRQWRWGKLHTLELRHPLSSLRWVFPPLGPVASGGDSETPAQTGLTVREGWPGAISVAAPWRFLISMGNPEEALTSHAPGQSGHPASPHYQDEWPDWLAGYYRRPARSARHVLKLI